MIYRFNKCCLILIALIFIFGCDTQNTCSEYNIKNLPALQISFGCLYKSKSKVVSIDSALPQIVVYYRDSTDTMKNVKSILLTLPQTEDSSHYSLKFNEHTASEITVSFKRTRVFISYECGFRTDFELNATVIKPNPFDSINIVRTVVTDVNEENIRLYFNRPDTAGKL